ncbi:Probable bifunctional methylthioribulose-1-phosphate dehydratase/enolase-phosphatase E1 2 [Linum perenne]
MSPSGVHKERMQPDDMYVMSGDGSIMHAPSPKPYPHKPPNCCDCAPLFMKPMLILLSVCTSGVSDVMQELSFTVMRWRSLVFWRCSVQCQRNFG